MGKPPERAFSKGATLATLMSIASEGGVSDDVKKHILTLISESDKDVRSLQLEERKWYSSTPLAIALTGLITIGANFFVTYSLNRQAANNAVTAEQIKNEFAVSMEQLKNELQLSSEQNAHALGIRDEEKRFEFEIVRSELSRTELSQPERAGILLFLVRGGVLNDLNKAELELMAKEGSVPELSPPPGVRQPLDSITPQDLQALFDKLVIKPEKLDDIKMIAERINGAQARYQAVGGATGIPWQIVGTLHQLETGGDFSVHLNGDPLPGRTVNLPTGQPADGDPPFTWEQSAIALIPLFAPKLATAKSIGEALDQIERVNGLGYRRRGLYSPYLWACSEQYTSGAYAADAVFKPDQVASRCGAAVILKQLLETTTITF
jgi:lysozyme family protein